MSSHRVVISALEYGQTCQNVLHFTNPDGFLTPQQIATDVFNNWVMKVSENQNGQLIYTSILVQNLDDPNLAPFNLIVARQGQSFNDRRIPASLAGVIKLSTARAGKHGRGRVFLAGVVSDHMQDGQYTPTGLVFLQQNMVDPLFAAYGPSSTISPLLLCVREKLQGGFALHPVIAMQLRSVIGVQRRRTIGVGV